VAALASVLTLTLACVADEARRASTAPVARHTASGAPVVFQTLAKDSGRFHLFLSHVWSTGQDQVLAIKKELAIMAPTLRIFLDIEDLTDIGGLEGNVEGSDMTLMFLSRSGINDNLFIIIL
jgi:hypothetical protein